ncbi:cbb3-type cytochrome c oxidase subunit I, partial [Lacticaseibacillus rhamnosus]|uniref:cbb3-type cytochrome c oxidase subunit I n=1 Tax=Lacticaseibacillus rhamnosus TaxID=47715 RepID=UPI003F446F77
HIRTIHTNGVLLAWLSMAMVGAMFYMIPKLTRTPLWSERLGNLTCIIWNLAIAAAVVVICMGYSTGVEYAELPLVLDIGVIILCVLMSINLF